MSRQNNMAERYAELRLTPEQIEVLQSLVGSGIYPSKSEAVRDAVRKYIRAYEQGLPIEQIETAQVKKATGRMSAECLPPAETSKLIEEVAKRAVINLKSGKAPKPFKVSAPIKMTIEFVQSDMADKAALMPGAKRTNDRHVDYTSDNIVTIYQAFRTMLSAAR